MIKEIENTATSAEAAVVYGKIGRACSRALAQEAARSALRTTRTQHTTKFQSARQTRLQARKGGERHRCQPATATASAGTTASSLSGP